MRRWAVLLGVPLLALAVSLPIVWWFNRRVPPDFDQVGGPMHLKPQPASRFEFSPQHHP